MCLSPSPAEIIDRLNELAAELAGLGWTTEVCTAKGKLRGCTPAIPNPAHYLYRSLVRA
jgi:hypothetical protein